MKPAPHVLVVAGSDSSGGAGIVRDIETIAHAGLRTCLAVTSLTVQTHAAVGRIDHVPPDLVAAQMCAALSANRVAAIKIGVLGTAQTIAAIAAVLREHQKIPVVLDPVLASSSGRVLLEQDAIASMKHDLLPLCCLVTPNLAELATLAGSSQAAREADVLRQGRKLLAGGCNAVLAKGGHGATERSTDILFRLDREPVRFDAPRQNAQLRGTGCILASAIAAGLARAQTLETSINTAKQMVSRRLAEAAGGECPA